MLGISRKDHVTNVSVYQTVNECPLSNTVKARQLKWLGHTLRRDPNDLVNEFALYHPTHGHRRRGGHKRLYHQYITRVFNSEFQLTPAELRLAAQDKEDWRESLVAACRYQPP